MTLALAAGVGAAAWSLTRPGPPSEASRPSTAPRSRAWPRLPPSSSDVAKLSIPPTTLHQSPSSLCRSLCSLASSPFAPLFVPLFLPPPPPPPPLSSEATTRCSASSRHTLAATSPSIPATQADLRKTEPASGLLTRSAITMALACSPLGTYESSSSLASLLTHPASLSCASRDTRTSTSQHSCQGKTLDRASLLLTLIRASSAACLTLGEESVTAPRRALGRTLAQASWAAAQSASEARERTAAALTAAAEASWHKSSAAFTISLTPCRGIWCQCCARTTDRHRRASALHSGTGSWRPWTMASACLLSRSPPCLFHSSSEAFAFLSLTRGKHSDSSLMAFALTWALGEQRDLKTKGSCVSQIRVSVATHLDLLSYIAALSVLLSISASLCVLAPRHDATRAGKTPSSSASRHLDSRAALPAASTSSSPVFFFFFDDDRDRHAVCRISP